MTIRGLLFDVDGTLAETEDWHRRAFNAAFVQSGLVWHWDEPVYRRLLAVTGGRERLLHFAGQTQGIDAASFDAMARRVHALKNELYQEFVRSGQVCLRTGITDLLDAAAEIRLDLGIVTTTSRGNVAALLQANLGPDWAARFKVVVAGEDVVRKKPSPEAYIRAMAALALHPAEAVALEDSANGVTAAHGAGLRVIAIRSQYCCDDDLRPAAHVLQTFEGLDIGGLLATKPAVACAGAP